MSLIKSELKSTLTKVASEVKKCSVSSPACLTSDLSWVQVAPLPHRDHILCWTGLEKREGLKLK